MRKMTQLLQVVDDDYDSDELMWVKAGEPGEKPTIIRQIRSESSSSGSRDNSGGSCNRRNQLTVENGKVYCSGVRQSAESLETLERIARTSSSESRVIVVNVHEPIYPAVVDKQRIQRWKELHSPRTSKKLKTNNNNNKKQQKDTSPTVTNNNTIERPNFHIKSHTRPLSQPTRPISNCSPKIERCASAEPSRGSPMNSKVVFLKCRDEGYTSLTEDCKDSDNESVRSKSLPSSWRPIQKRGQHQEKDLHKYAQRMTSNNSTDCHYPYHDDSEEVSEEKPLNEEEQKLAKRKQKRHDLRQKIENTIEICTCFVCIRSAVYHAEDEDDTDSLVDRPCTCEEPGVKCCLRWGMISLMVCFFPFLLCYPPLKTCLNLHDRRKKLKRKKNKKKLKKEILNQEKQRELELQQT